MHSKYYYLYIVNFIDTKNKILYKNSSSSLLCLNMTYLRRTLEPIIEKASEHFKVVMLSGLRQVGKSTLLKMIAGENRRYITLDNTAQRLMANEDPSSFFEHNQAPAIVDEIQLAPSLFRPLKEKVDEQNGKGQYWLSGSQRLHLMHQVSDALPGRLIAFDLYPLSVYERLGLGLEQKPFVPGHVGTLPKFDTSETWEMIFQGAWPEVLNLDHTERQWFFDSLIDLYLSRDVAALTGVEKTLEFRKFLKALAARTGQELRIQILAQMCDVGMPTIKRWLSIAEASGLIYLLPAFSGNINKQIVKSPKVYLADTGLAAALLGISSPQEMQNHIYNGALFETFVITEILKSYCHNGKKPDFYFYRDSTGMEIDLLIHSEGLYYPIEIKMKKTPDTYDAKWIRALEKFNIALGTAAIIALPEAAYNIAPEITVQSIWDI